MPRDFFFVIFLFLGGAAALEAIPFRQEKELHSAESLPDARVKQLARLSNTTNLNEILDNICVVRVVGSESHKRVGKYIKNSMDNLGWTTEIDAFQDDTPNLGRLTFRNIVAKLNPKATRFLTLACHYDSKYSREGDFVGATDSAVPCAQMINLATVMRKRLDPLKQKNLSLMFIFFDGEEAFYTWGPKDSLYGARHLAQKWHNVGYEVGDESDITHLDRIDLLVLLDLLGAPDPHFYNYQVNSNQWYERMVEAESALARLRLFDNYSYDKQPYFDSKSSRNYIEDDHVPFWERGVPVLHLIPTPFPGCWHKSEDNRGAVSINTTENLNKILRVFVATYFNLFSTGISPGAHNIM